MNISERAHEFLSPTQVCVLATTGPGNSPHAVPMWYRYRDGVITISTLGCIAHGESPTNCYPQYCQSQLGHHYRSRTGPRASGNDVGQHVVPVHSGRGYAAAHRLPSDLRPMGR